MGLTRILINFTLVLGVSTATAFLGYRYLGLANEYRSRNFVHLTQVQNALNITQAAAVLRPEEAADLAGVVRMARDQSVWCLDNLTTIEAMFFKRLGPSAALEVCQKDIETANRALSLLADMLDPALLAARGPDSAFAKRLTLIDELERMRQESLDFHPYVEIIENRLTTLVRLGTTATALALAAVFILLLRLQALSWRRLASQTKDIARMSQRFSLALKASGEGIALFDSSRRLIACNDMYRTLAHGNRAWIKEGMAPEQIMRGALAHGLYRNAPRNGRNRDKLVSDHFKRLEETPEGIQLELTGDRHVVEKMALTSLGDMLISRTDITEFVRNERRQADHARKLEAAAHEIDLRAQTDALTNLPNRRKLDLVLQDRPADDNAPLIRIDLDRFKQVNDVLGHDAGDFVLCKVADILRKHTRPGDLPARIGGDEFVVVCAPDTSMEEAKAMSERLLSDILEPVRFGKKRCIYGASFGIASGRPGQSDAASVLRDADYALYHAKRGGRGRIDVFSDQMRQAANRDRVLADDLVEALANGEIIPYFQTQHDARTHALTGVEVLARWAHPREGVLPPNTFLPIAYQLGMEAEIDATIYRKAVEALRLLDKEGDRIPTAAFNVSAARIADPGFVRQVTETIETDHDRIVFEILESVSMESMGSVIHFAVDALKEAGFRIEVDDFGSGHASINSLLDIQPHALKIDRNLIRPLGDSDRAEQTVGAIIDMARSVNVEVVAEGVDTIEKAHILMAKGCDRLQGFLFSKPMPLDAMRSFLRNPDLPGQDKTHG